MISAMEALELPGARIPSDTKDELKAVMEIIEDHIRSKMLFTGPPTLEIPYKSMTTMTAKVLVHIMKREKWAASVTLAAEQSAFRGGAPQPHHWVFQFMPQPEVYDELLADFDFDKPQLIQ